MRELKGETDCRLSRATLASAMLAHAVVMLIETRSVVWREAGREVLTTPGTESWAEVSVVILSDSRENEGSVRD